MIQSEPLKYGAVKREKNFFITWTKSIKYDGNLRLLEAIMRNLNIKPTAKGRILRRD